MEPHSDINADPISRARKAAELVWDDKAVPPDLEPVNVREAQAAVKRLSELFEQLPASFKKAMDGASSSGTLISSDRLQGLAEIIQNADDVKASELLIQLRNADLLVSHNGNPVRLNDALALAMPWLTNKAGDAASTGRFGIGLSTLQSLSKTFELHCAPYHVEIGDPTIAPIESADLPPEFSQPNWTTLRIPLADGTLQPSELDQWLSRWDDSALLFLRHVTRVTSLDPDCDTIRLLELSRHQDKESVTGPESIAMSRERVEASDGRSWAVYSSHLPSPENAERARKATGSTTPVSLAFPLGAAIADPERPTKQSEPDDTATVRSSPSKTGLIYAGLPVAQTRLPFFANAQFDPLTSREGVADTPWNKELVKLVVGVWSEALLDLFEHDPQTAWQAVPLPQSEENETASGSGVIAELEAAVIEQARQEVASRLTFPVPSQGRVGLSELAVEAQPLEGLLDDSEIAQLTGLHATLPSGVRDPAGRWRSVLDDWRHHGADLPHPVSVSKALDLLSDESRSIDSTIALVAAALREGLEDLDERLHDFPCVIAQDGRRLPPPPRDGTDVLSTEAVPLAEQLGIAVLLHPAHLAKTNDATAVLEWLRECGALLDDSDDVAVVRRLAQAGQSQNCIEEPLSDEQICSLRDAFERLPQKDRDKLGPRVGHAVRLKSYTYDAEGQKKAGSARPVDTYLPKAIISDQQRFADAADKSKGPVWLSSHYAQALRSPTGREGLGARKFLGLLGAETAPRLRPHPQQQKRYNDSRRGLSKEVSNGPATRKTAMSKLGATYTLDDHDSPDLHAVITDIARESKSKQRRRRAEALLGTLARAWESRLSDFAEVKAADARYRWNPKGITDAVWLAHAKEIAWLDDESGTARKPADLRVRTPGNEAIYGTDSPDYLHTELVHATPPGRRALLEALGVSTNPSQSELIKQLQELQQTAAAGEALPNDLQLKASLVYKALAVSLKNENGDSDLTANELQHKFKQHKLLLTKQGWLPPQEVFGGPPIFGDRRPFAAAIRGCDPLWEALQLKEPSPEDCVKVLQEVAKGRKREPEADEKAILLETFEKLAEHWKNGETSEKSKMAKLALWTTKGWQRQRPVYATDDRSLIAGLGDHLAIWCPGVELEQFRPLLEPLKVNENLADNAHEINPEHAYEDDELTEVFRQAVGLLHEKLLHKDTSLPKKLKTQWDSLETYSVKVHQDLELRVEVDPNQAHNCEVDAKVDIDAATVYVKNRDVLGRVEKGGRALAALFEGNPENLAMEWVAAYQNAQDGIEKRNLERAEERAARQEAEMEDRLVEFQESTAERHGSRANRASQSFGSSQRPETSTSRRAPLGPAHAPAAPRVLHDPGSLTLVDPAGRRTEGPRSPAGSNSERSSALSSPRSESIAPQSRTPPPLYTSGELESAGLELLRRVLGGDSDEIVDLRTQRGVGADAVDELRRYYELKVHAGKEPDQVTLTYSGVKRALSTPDFFLVVVSNIEKSGDTQPTVRVFLDPLKQLQPTDRGSITLSGVREAKSLIYTFDPTDEGLTPDSRD